MPTDRKQAKLIVSAYAQALIKASLEKDSAVVVQRQLNVAVLAIRESYDLKEALCGHELDGKTRASIVRGVFEGFDDSLLAVLSVMAERKEMKLLSRVRNEYQDLMESESKTVLVDVRTAIALNDSVRSQIKAKVASDFPGMTVELDEHVDPDIIGGIIMSVHGSRLDASMKTQLERARRALSATVPGGE